MYDVNGIVINRGIPHLLSNTIFPRAYQQYKIDFRLRFGLVKSINTRFGLKIRVVCMEILALNVHCALIEFIVSEL